MKSTDGHSGISTDSHNGIFLLCSVSDPEEKQKHIIDPTNDIDIITTAIKSIIDLLTEITTIVLLPQILPELERLVHVVNRCICIEIQIIQQLRVSSVIQLLNPNDRRR